MLGLLSNNASWIMATVRMLFSCFWRTPKKVEDLEHGMSAVAPDVGAKTPAASPRPTSCASPKSTITASQNSVSIWAERLRSDYDMDIFDTADNHYLLDQTEIEVLHAIFKRTPRPLVQDAVLPVTQLIKNVEACTQLKGPDLAAIIEAISSESELRVSRLSNLVISWRLWRQRTAGKF